MRPKRLTKGTHFEGLSLRLVSRIVDLPGASKLLCNTLLQSIGYPLLEALEVPDDVPPYSHQHLIAPAPPPGAGTKEGQDG